MNVDEFNANTIAEFRANRGKVGGSFEGAPILLLHTIGARSGHERTSPMMYLADGDRYLVFASNAGSDRNPAWYWNLRANPEASIEVGEDRIEVRAVELTGTERDATYAEQASRFPGFADYERRTTRTIPVLALTPRGRAAEHHEAIELLIAPGDRAVPITVQQRTSLSPADSMALIAPIDLTAVFRPVAPFPGVAAVANQTEDWDHAGPRRNPRFTDGSQVDEQLTEYVAGSSFAYQLTGFTNALSGLAVGVRGEWTFAPDGSGTLIRWSYEFKPRPGRRWILAGPFTPLWRRYMTKALARCVEVSEVDFAASPSR